MVTPLDANARRYYRAAYQRFGDGKALMKLQRPQASIYLTGYAVECILKSLLLTCTPIGERPRVLATFRGNIAHQIGWLRDQVVSRCGRLPLDQARDIAFVRSWSTDLRYEPGPGNSADAEAFIKAADSILKWADRRM